MALAPSLGERDLWDQRIRRMEAKLDDIRGLWALMAAIIMMYRNNVVNIPRALSCQRRESSEIQFLFFSELLASFFFSLPYKFGSVFVLENRSPVSVAVMVAKRASMSFFADHRLSLEAVTLLRA